ncbi:MAG: hypothetical protein ACLPSW_18100, partial [Roseiarcus sp.]
MNRKARVRQKYHAVDVECDAVPHNIHSGPDKYGIDVIYLKRHLLHLPHICRTMFILNKIYGMTYPEIASH